MAGQASNTRASSDDANRVADQRSSVDGAVVAHLRARHHLICRRIPLKRRRLVWARALYFCNDGPKHESGPFAGEYQGGCGWHRDVYVGVGVGKPAAPGVSAIPLPPRAGFCERCGGQLELNTGSGFAPLPGERGPDERLIEGVPRLLVPGKRVGGRMAHSGEFYAQLHEAEPEDIANPGER